MRTRFLSDQRGAISIMTAASCVAVIGFTGLAVDVGSVYLQARKLQGAADLAAIAAAQSPAQDQALAQATVRDNGWNESTRVETTRGVYTAERDIAPDRRFVAGSAGANAVRVQLTSTAPLYFGRLFLPSGQMEISRHAVAAQTRLASFEIGSRLLSLRGGIANDLLGALTGSSVSLSAMDYNALLSADVDLFAYADALRTRLNLRAATFDQTLQQRVTPPVALNAIADVLQPNNARAASAMRALASASSGAPSISGLNKLLDLGPYADQDHVDHIGATEIDVNALDLATAVLQTANGNRQVRLDLGASVPGLTQTTAWLAIGERPAHSPWLTVTADNAVIVRTAQMRLYVEANVATTPPLSSLASLRVPVLLEMASAQARLADVSCPLGSTSARSVTLSVAPSIGSLSLGEVNTSQLDNFNTTLRPSAAQLLRVGLVRVEGTAHVDVGGQQWQDVRFSNSEIDRGAVKTVQTRDVAQATFSTLLANTNLTVRAGGLGLSTGAITSSATTALRAAGAPLDQILNTLSDLLGVRLGEADVRVNGVRCGGAALVA